MRISEILKYGLVGFGLQVVLHIIAIVAPREWRPGLMAVYYPAIKLGGYLTEPSGTDLSIIHFGAIVGWLIAIVIYSVLVGVVIVIWKRSRSE